MAFATQPNMNLTEAWSLVADGSAEGTIQIVGGWPVVVAIGAASPAAGNADGMRVSDVFSWSGLTTEKVFARAGSADRPTTIAIVKG